jgi:GT2 family glycosyltransferase
MKLSVIIVNYNVKHFLEQALLSVQSAAQGIATEVWVVDNNSQDGSVDMVKKKFSDVQLIENKENTGFSKANNQAIQLANGHYILLLNPDTVVSEDTFKKCLDFMDAHANVGGLGIKTIDGSGAFLPESKRGFPSPWVAFCKSFGLSALFPKSALFNRYYLGHLDKNQTHECDVLVGSFMLMRKKVLDKIGRLDEAFFMYGEDIDLSYRITQAGFKNYYFAESTIIHYKGESTKKGSLNYVKVFYGAMMIFARKHFQGQKAAFFIALMQIAVWFRAFLTVVGSVFKVFNLPIFDALTIFIGLFFLKDFWSNYYFKDPTYIKPSFLFFNAPLYITIWLSSIYFSGGYDKPISMRRILRGVLVGTVILSAVYGFLNLNLRSSRMLIVLGALWTGLSLFALRLIDHFIKNKNFHLGTEGVKNTLLIGQKMECERAKKLLSDSSIAKNIVGFVSPHTTSDFDNYLGSIERIDTLTAIFKVENIIFCSKDIDNQAIINYMEKWGNRFEYKILPAGSDSIIGSSNKNTTGDVFTSETLFQIASPTQRRNKRVFDIIASLLIFILSPILIFFTQKISIVLQNLLPILFGKKTLVSYHYKYEDSETLKTLKTLPNLKQGIFSPINTQNLPEIDTKIRQKAYFFYAKDYSIWLDWQVIKRELLS